MTADTPAAAPITAPWRCFHCDAVFTDETSAREHFGASERQDPACTISVAEYRRMEEAHRRQCEDDTDWHRAFYKLGGDHQRAMRSHGDAEYARGLRDGVNLPPDSAARAALSAPVAAQPADPLLGQALAALVRYANAFDADAPTVAVIQAMEARIDAAPLFHLRSFGDVTADELERLTAAPPAASGVDALWVERLRETAVHLRENSLRLAKYPDMGKEARARELAALYIAEIAEMYALRAHLSTALTGAAKDVK